MDALRKQIEALQIPDEALELQSCRSAVLQMVAFCEKQQQLNHELAMTSALGAKVMLEEALRISERAMKSEITKLSNFTLTLNTVRTLSHIAHGTNLHDKLHYDNGRNQIMIRLNDDNEDEDEKYITITEKFNTDGDAGTHFIIDSEDLQPEVYEMYKLPIKLETLEGLVFSLNQIFDGLAEDFQAENSFDLSASAVFRP